MKWSPRKIVSASTAAKSYPRTSSRSSSFQRHFGRRSRPSTPTTRSNNRQQDESGGGDQKRRHPQHRGNEHLYPRGRRRNHPPPERGSDEREGSHDGIHRKTRPPETGFPPSQRGRLPAEVGGPVSGAGCDPAIRLRGDRRRSSEFVKELGFDIDGERDGGVKGVVLRIVIRTRARPCWSSVCRSPIAGGRYLV